MKSQYAGSCPKCSKAFVVGDEIFITKVGESWIKCVDKECFESQGGKVFEGGKGKFQSQKHPITVAGDLYALSEKILQEFKDKRKEQGALSTNDEAVFIMSFFRTLSGNFKP